ncbi:tripartite tricarboxylate transporter TctB family protein [Rhizobium anhuiense]|uniref:tripartite tricarboxylate transporter TctB family protein n=1 Tax=Rhizobium anhuiense TaxID=1184720 RepID=UPI0015CF6491|nr:tripartite tricarboxylate transporter TctB family protein [Rhizobium anhuiense]
MPAMGATAGSREWEDVMIRLRCYAYDWITWLMFAAIPVLIFWQSAISLAEQDAASGGPLENAAFYPRVVAVFMSVIVVAQGARLVLGRVRQNSAFRVEKGTRLAIALTLLFVVYLITLPYIGFHIATPILCAAMMRGLGVSTVPAVLGGVTLWLGSSYVFEGLLNVVLPVGMFNLAIFR